MEDQTTWRKLLSFIAQTPEGLQQIAKCLDRHPKTLQRWIAGKASPKRYDLVLLLQSIPSHYQEEMNNLLKKEFPHWFENGSIKGFDMVEVPSAFYEKMLSVYTNDPMYTRGATIIAETLSQVVKQLDPQRRGLLAALSQWMSATAGKQIRSLRRTATQSSEPWKTIQEQAILLLGEESSEMRAIHRMVPDMVFYENNSEPGVPPFEKNCYSIAFPIARAGRIAGCLTIYSSHLLSEDQQRLAQSYAHLLVLGFEVAQFHTKQDIEIGMMPPAKLQREIIQKLPVRTKDLLLQAQRQQRVLTRHDAEELVWQQIEEELLEVERRRQLGDDEV